MCVCVDVHVLDLESRVHYWVWVERAWIALLNQSNIAIYSPRISWKQGQNHYRTLGHPGLLLKGLLLKVAIVSKIKNTNAKKLEETQKKTIPKVLTNPKNCKKNREKPHNPCFQKKKQAKSFRKNKKHVPNKRHQNNWKIKKSKKQELLKKDTNTYLRILMKQVFWNDMESFGSKMNETKCSRRFSIRNVHLHRQDKTVSTISIHISKWAKDLQCCSFFSPGGKYSTNVQSYTHPIENTDKR